MTLPVDPKVLELAMREHQAGRFSAAERLYRTILSSAPQHPDALRFLGVLAYQQGRFLDARDFLCRVIAVAPEYASAFSDLGNVLRAMEEFDEAVKAFRHVLSLNPNHAVAHSNLGNTLIDMGQVDDAISAFQTAITLNPTFVDAYFNLGNALTMKRRWVESVKAYEQAILHRPNHAVAHRHLGCVLNEIGKVDEAIGCFRHALLHDAQNALAHTDLGNALRSKNEIDEAITSFRSAIAADPKYDVAYTNLGSALKEVGQLDEMVAAHRASIALNPSSRVAHNNLILAMLVRPGEEPGEIREELRRWNARHAAPLKQFIRPHPNDRNPARRLRIGYVSADFRDHASAFFILPLLRNHDRRQVEVYCYSEREHSDMIAREMRDLVPNWRVTSGRSDAEVAATIRQDKIDILVDLKLHTAMNRLGVFAHKPAPVQVTWLGYPGSTGMDAMDYRLTDPYLDPPGLFDDTYSERSIRLPETFWCYDPLCQEPEPGALPCVTNGFTTFGCLNSFHKVNASLLKLWARVLRSVAGSRLMMLTPEGVTRKRVLQQLAGEGISADQVLLVPRQVRADYLGTYQRIDIGLDTVPYNGHTTSLDSLWMGVPVVTLVGSTVVGRAGISFLSNLGLRELIAHDPADYVRIAAELAGDVPRLAEVRRALRERMRASPLMDAPRFARHMESALRQMWQTWCTQNAGA